MRASVFSLGKAHGHGAQRAYSEVVFGEATGSSAVQRFTLLPLVVACALPLAAMADSACRASSSPGVTPLVELYTAEGCSDCPKADAWLTETASAMAAEDASFLAFHVDYWDSIGWPDRFSAGIHSDRQRLRVAQSGKRVVYTPQVMIGEATTVDWQRPGRGARAATGGRNEFGRVLDAARSRDANVRLDMAVLGADDEALLVRLDASGAARDDVGRDVWIWLALYEDGLVSRVSAGENQGRTLRHDRVVRALKGPWRLSADGFSQEIRLEVPQDAETASAGLVAFVEAAETGRSLQSLGLRLDACVGDGIAEGGRERSTAPADAGRR
ncbi:DUF1223 domain-containing protein [Luteimonas sp. SJ-92]|uniref:DUF1223 domain-containing protein n=1 Tax=Luteimonas salinisoli TaxID=2752307 RepID=A0A853JCV6_9GAMM|nr:DUF1223 domain-containing protein [Luteimonas salinisoli]NZA26675.1 DUF1223 domain-containing protein [Luteimonas salinisoli]